MIHQAYAPAVRALSSKRVLEGIIPVPAVFWHPDFFSASNFCPSQVNSTIVASPVIGGPHRLTIFQFQTSKAANGADVLSVLVSSDTRVDIGALDRDRMLIGTNPNINWVSFQNIPTVIRFDEVMRRHITVYKFCWRNLTAGAANCTGLLRWER